MDYLVKIRSVQTPLNGQFSIGANMYDLTNTYFEGEVPHNTKARHGRSKEKRTDCPLVTLGLVLDGSGPST